MSKSSWIIYVLAPSILIILGFLAVSAFTPRLAPTIADITGWSTSTVANELPDNCKAGAIVMLFISMFINGAVLIAYSDKWVAERNRKEKAKNKSKKIKVSTLSAFPISASEEHPIWTEDGWICPQISASEEHPIWTEDGWICPQSQRGLLRKNIGEDTVLYDSQEVPSIEEMYRR